jgi:hypothetical protein
MPEKYTIRDVRELPSRDPLRPGKSDAIITVQALDGKIMVLRVPAEAVTEAAIKAALQAVLSKRSSWEGREITI